MHFSLRDVNFGFHPTGLEGALGKSWMKEITDKLDFIKIENFSVKDSIKSKTGKKYL